MINTEEIRLTQFSHGAGCGCKIAPNVLEQILATHIATPADSRLLVGNETRDDAAVYDLGNGTALIATTDFFMPIVDDPYNFGRIAAANAISDVYAMGGKPFLAIAILGWPVNKLGPGIAKKVIEGGRSICLEAGIVLAGGHSIDSPEPVFGLAVNGLVDIKNIKQNNTAMPGDVLFLTKKIGVGILTTAEKKGVLKEEHRMLATRQMMQLNTAGEALGKITGVTAMTDVTGFGLLGHLKEMCIGSGTSAVIDMNKVPLITDDLLQYIYLHAVPGGTGRNLESYTHNILFSGGIDEKTAGIMLADPQTSGGLLVAVAPSSVQEVQDTLASYGLYNISIGNITEQQQHLITVR